MLPGSEASDWQRCVPGRIFARGKVAAASDLQQAAGAGGNGFDGQAGHAAMIYRANAVHTAGAFNVVYAQQFGVRAGRSRFKFIGRAKKR